MQCENVAPYSEQSRGMWVTLLVKCPILDLSLDLDLGIVSSSPVLWGVEPT